MANGTETVRLLDVEPELAAHLREDDRAEARERLVVPVQVLKAGEAIGPPDGTVHSASGIMVIDGMLLQEVAVQDHSALQLLGPGDVVLRRMSVGDTTGAKLHWTAAAPTRVAVLDYHLQRAFVLWPGLAIGLLERAGVQLTRMSVQAAICQLPRVHQRLLATFWDLAERWGRVTPSGIHIPLMLTHEVLARLVGGRRPTITLALVELAERGLLLRLPDRTWRLTGDAAPAQPERQPVPAAARVTLAPDTPLQPDAAPWIPAALDDLLARTRQLRTIHDEQRRQLTEDRERFVVTRDRSRQLRLSAGELRRRLEPGRS